MPTRDLNVRLGLDTAQFERGMNRAVRNLDRFARRVESTGRELTTRLTVPIVAVGAAAVSSFAKFDKLEKGLSAIAGSAEAGKQQFKQLLDVVKDTQTTLNLEDAARGSLILQAVGLEAGQAAETLRQLAIAATAAGNSSDDVAEVARQLAQAAAKGNILQQELRIILERLPALAGVIKQEFGTVTAEGLREAGVSADEFISRLTSAIANSEKLQAVQGGLAKALETFGIEAQIAAAELGKTIAEAINLEEILGKLSSLISTLVQRFSSLDESTKRIIVVSGVLAAALGPVLIAIGSIVRLLPVAVSGLKAFGFASSAVIGIIGGLAFAFSTLVNYFGDIDEALAFTEAKFAQLVAVAKETVAVIADEFRILGVSIQLALAGNFGAAAANLTLSAGNAAERIREAGSDAFDFSILESALQMALREQERLGQGVSNGGFNPEDLFGGLGDGSGINGSIEPLNKMQEALGGVREKIAALGELPTLNLLNEEIQSVSASTEHLGEIQSAVGQQSQSFAERQRELLNVFDNFNVRLTNVVEGGLASFVEGFGQAIGALATGAANAGQVFASLTGIFAGILERLGKIAIETGIGLLAIQTAFKTLNPFVALAAGAALIAFSKIIRAQVKDVAAFAEGGLVFGPTLGLVGEGPGTTRSNPEVIAPLDKLRGMLDGGRGSGFVASTRLDGDDLLLIIERAEQRQNRIR